MADPLDALAASLRDTLLAETAEADPTLSIRAIVDRDAGVLDEATRTELCNRIAEASFGLGPLEPLLADPDVDELMVCGTAPVWVERRGRLEQTAVRFAEEAELRHAIERILAPLGRRVDEASPLADARLPERTVRPRHSTPTSPHVSGGSSGVARSGGPEVRKDAWPRGAGGCRARSPHNRSARRPERPWPHGRPAGRSARPPSAGVDRELPRVRGRQRRAASAAAPPFVNADHRAPTYPTSLQAIVADSLEKPSVASSRFGLDN